MARLHLAPASDITAEVIAIIDFLGTSEVFGFLLLGTVCKSLLTGAVTIGDDKSAVLQTTGDISSLLSSIVSKCTP